MSLLGDIKDVGSAVVEIGKAAKGLIGNADKLAGGVKGLGNLFQRFSTAGRLSDLARLGRKLSEYGDDALRFLAKPEIKKFLKSARTPILAGGQTAIAGMKLTTGFGSPDDGERFSEGASRFRRASETLTGAYPNGSWKGSASETYSDSNSRQVGRTQTMAATDQSINSVLAREAGQITATRTVLDEQSDWLADVGLVTMLVAATPYVGQGAALAMEIAAVTKALGACTIQLTELTQQVNSNAAEIQQTVGRYGEVPQKSNMTKTGPGQTTAPGPRPPSPGPEDGDAPGDTAAAPPCAPSPERTQPGPVGAGTGSGSGSGGGTASGSGGGSASGGASRGDKPPTPEVPEKSDRSVPAPQIAPASRPSTGGAGLGSPAPPLSSVPAATAGAMPAAAAAGMSAAQIASLVQSAVQRAMQEEAAKDKAEKADNDTDGDGTPDVEEDENRDGIPDVEQDLPHDDTDGDGKPGEAGAAETGAAPGAPQSGRAPVDFAVDTEPARMTSAMSVSLDRNDPIGSPSPAQR